MAATENKQLDTDEVNTCFCFECQKHIPNLPRGMKFCFKCKRHTVPFTYITDDIYSQIEKTCQICSLTHRLLNNHECCVCKDNVCTWCFHHGKWILLHDDNVFTINISQNCDDLHEYGFSIFDDVLYVCSERCRLDFTINYPTLIQLGFLSYIQHA